MIGLRGCIHMRYTLTKNQLALTTCEHKHFYLQWGTGKGKTLGALSWWIGKNYLSPLLIVGPASKMSGTRDWQETTGYLAYYTSYESFNKVVSMMPKPPKAIIFDEAHKIKNYKTKTWKTIEPYAKNAETLWLSATPMNSGLWERYTFLSLILGVSPRVLDSKNTIWERAKFITPHQVFERIGYRNDYKDILSKHSSVDLEPVEDVELNVEHLDFIETNIVRDLRIAPQKLLSKFRLGHLNIRSKRLSLIHQQQSKQKLDFIKSLDNKYVVIFTRFKSDIEFLKNELVDCGIIDGSSKETDYRKHKYLLVNIQAGNAGIELNHSDVAIYYKPPVAPIEYIQSLGRLVRTNQEHKFVSYYILTQGVLERKTYQNLLKNKKTVEEELIE
jgi:superfamily II DNA or RNA helicase